jgi:hypothetical protein
MTPWVQAGQGGHGFLFQHHAEFAADVDAFLGASG